MRLGQAQPLQRRQWSRLIDGLRECFAKLGDDALRDFDQRFEHGPRRRTVGPWCWRVAPGDVWEVVANTRPALADELVAEGDPRAAFLYAAVGDEIPQSAVEKFGLVDGKLPENDGSLAEAEHLAAVEAAANAQRLASAAGCEAYVLEGGIDAWKKAGLPVAVDQRQPIEIMRQVQITAGSLVLLGVILGFVSGIDFRALRTG